MRVGLALALWFLVLCKFAAATSNITNGGHTVFISPSNSPDDMQFRLALANESVVTIVFAGDYSVGKSQFADYSGPYKEGTPLLEISRNVTLTGLPGQLPLLDLNFQMSVVELCNNCTFTIENMAIANERQGANAQLDFFLGHGGSVLNLTNVIRKRMSCTSINPALHLVESTSRAARFPAQNSSTKQIYAADDVTFRGVVYPKTLHLIDYSVEFPRHYNGGYDLVLYNVYRMCDGFVDDACLETNDADHCVSMHMAQLLESQAGSSRPGSSGGLAPGAVAGIAVAAAVGVVALVGVLVAVLLCHRKAGAAGAAEFCHTKDVEAGPQPLQPYASNSTAPCSSSHGTSSKCTMDPVPQACAPPPDGSAFVTGADTSSASLHTLEPAPGLLATSYDLAFGALLGSGSFGRVYKARWKDKDVAVKVIEHDTRMAAAVANEVQLMLSCNHPNVVRAYHYITHTAARSTASNLLSGGGGSSEQSASVTPSFAAQLQQVNLFSSDQQTLQNPSSDGNASSNQVPRNTAGQSSVGAVRQLLHAGHQSPQPTPTGAWQPQQPPRIPAGHQDVSGSSSIGQGKGAVSKDHVVAGTPTAQPSPLQQQQQHEVVSGLLGHGLPPALPQHTNDVIGQPSGSVGAEGPSLGAMDDSQWENVKTWLIQEFCDSGTLAKMSASWSPAKEDDAQMLKRLVLLQDVAKGLRYLHGRHVVHGDLNARNVLITSSPSSLMGYSAKLADLGLSRTIKQHATHHTTCTVGTMSHMPPELLRHGRMSTSVDIYSFGIMMWELFSREVAFRELHYGQFFETVVLKDLRPKVPPHTPEDYKLLMERCWSTDPADRPSSHIVCNCVALMIAERQQALGLQANTAASSDDDASAAPPVEEGSSHVSTCK